MAVDPYQLCPCGSGKKLKFCCSDLVGEIEKIHRMIEGDQPKAALRHAEQTLAKHPGRASLLDLKATLELALGEMDAARGTIDEFLKVDDRSPAAYADRAMLLAATEGGRAAVEPLQIALSLVDRDMPQRVFEAIGVVGRALLGQGHVVGAQAHLWLHVALAPKNDARALELLVSLNHYSGLPLLLRDNLRLRDWPAEAPWKAEADKASELSDLGRWQQAVEIVDGLGSQYGADPALVYNRAILGGRLGDDRALVAGLHAFAQLDVPLDDAVEAEAIAQLLDPTEKEDVVESVVRAYHINDIEALIERLAADKRVQSFELDPSRFPPDQPRPRHTYALLDRPLPDSGENITRPEVPILVGVIALFGRQTDRAERLEITTDRGPVFDQTIAELTEAAGEALGPMIDDRVVGAVSPTELALNWKWHFPYDTPPALRRKLLAEERHIAIVERWANVPRPRLNGKTPSEASGDPALRIPLMAAVLILEQGSNNRGDESTTAVLRDKLGLPQPVPIEPTAAGVDDLSLVRVPRLRVEAVTDDDLVQLYRRSVLVGARAATVLLAREAVCRPSLATRIPPTEAYRRLIAAEDDDEQALELIHEARRRSEEAGESTAAWELAELELHIGNGNAEEAQATLQRIERNHLDDPQVAAAVYQLLYETGVISAEDLQAPAMVGAAAPAATEAAAEPGRIWTPESERPAGKKSTLWTPS